MPTATAPAPTRNQSAAPALETPAAETQTEKRIRLFGNGNYSPSMFELFNDAQRRHGLDERQATKLAKQYGVDIGRALAEQPRTVKLGRLDSDHNMTLGDSVSKIKVHATHALLAAKIVADYNKLATQHKTVVEGVIKLPAPLMDWLSE